jgi:hypothetical protein
MVSKNKKIFKEVFDSLSYEQREVLKSRFHKREVRSLLEDKSILEEDLKQKLKNIAKAGAVGALLSLASLKASAQSGKVPQSVEMARTEVLRLASRLQLGKNQLIDITEYLKEWAPEDWEKFKKSETYKKQNGRLVISLLDFDREPGLWSRMSKEKQAAILTAVLERAVEVGVRSTKMPKGGKVIARIEYDFKTYKGVKELPTKKYRLKIIHKPIGKAGTGVTGGSTKASGGVGDTGGSQQPDPEFIKAWNEAVAKGLDKFWYEKGGYWVVIKLAEGSDEEKGTIELVGVGVELEEVPE